MGICLAAVGQEVGTTKAEATFSGQPVIVSMKGWQSIIGGCHTWGMLYPV